MFKSNEKGEEDTTVTEGDDSTEDTTEETNSEADKGSSKETDVEDEEPDDSEDITKQYFTDPESLDPKLRGAFKKMQGIFTKKMQEATTGIKKAQAFDQLILDPEFRAWMEERHNRVNGKTTSRKTSKDTDEDNTDEDDDAPMTRSALRKELQNLFKGIEKKGGEEQQARAMKAEAEQFKTDNPDWQIYSDAIMGIIEKHPTLSYQDAYDLAVREDKKKDDTKETMERKKKANINKPNKVTGKSTQKKGKMTVKEAFELAKKGMGL